MAFDKDFFLVNIQVFFTFRFCIGHAMSTIYVIRLIQLLE